MNETITALDTNTLILILLSLVAVSFLLIIMLIVSNRGLKREVNIAAKTYQQLGKTTNDLIDGRLRENGERVDTRLMDMNTRISSMAVENEQKLENIRLSMEQKMTDLTAENNVQLEKMRETVDEKLQKTLDDRISKSFLTVNDRLEQVYKGLGEMQSLAQGVGI